MARKFEVPLSGFERCLQSTELSDERQRDEDVGNSARDKPDPMLKKGETYHPTKESKVCLRDRNPSMVAFVVERMFHYSDSSGNGASELY